MGRTGRAGKKDGVAYTLIRQDESKSAAFLVRQLEMNGSKVGEEVEQLAYSDPVFKKKRATIGINGYNMKVNIVKEEKKMKNLRKIGDKSGIGFTNDGDNEDTNGE